MHVNELKMKKENRPVISTKQLTILLLKWINYNYSFSMNAEMMSSNKSSVIS